MADILILDDDQDLCQMLYEQMVNSGHTAVTCHNLASGTTLAQQHHFDVVLLDVELPDGNGLEYIPRFKNSPSEPEVIIITGQGEADGAECAVLSGAWS